MIIVLSFVCFIIILLPFLINEYEILKKKEKYNIMENKKQVRYDI